MHTPRVSRRTWIVVALIMVTVFPSLAAAYRRHYYSSWSYHSSNSYYYRSYYYKPAASYDGYRYHYCVYYPTRPRYVYYYNPYARVYWGRYDLTEKGYSQLADADRKEQLKDIPESAFPKPGEMPAIPESTDQERMLAIAPDDLPSGDAPKDAPSK